jgi:hypothetical protein
MLKLNPCSILLQLVCFLLSYSAISNQVGLPGDDVDQETPLHSSNLEVNGEVFNIKVFCGNAGRYFAKTCLSEDDVIITDGGSVPEALKKHEDLLPLAIGTRELTQSYLGFPRKPKVRRP